MPRSVFASVISTLDTKARKKCQSANISSSSSPSPADRAAASPDPTPNQPGTICRDWVQPKTQGIARSPASPAPLSGRRDGRDPMFIQPSCSTGVEARKYAGRSGSSTSDRYAACAPAETVSIAASQRASRSAGWREVRCSTDARSTAATVSSRFSRASAAASTCPR